MAFTFVKTSKIIIPALGNAAGIEIYRDKDPERIILKTYSHSEASVEFNVEVKDLMETLRLIEDEEL